MLYPWRVMQLPARKQLQMFFNFELDCPHSGCVHLLHAASNKPDESNLKLRHNRDFGVQ